MARSWVDGEACGSGGLGNLAVEEIGAPDACDGGRLVDFFLALWWRDPTEAGIGWVVFLEVFAGFVMGDDGGGREWLKRGNPGEGGVDSR